MKKIITLLLITFTLLNIVNGQSKKVDMIFDKVIELDSTYKVISENYKPTIISLDLESIAKISMVNKTDSMIVTGFEITDNIHALPKELIPNIKNYYNSEVLMFENIVVKIYFIANSETITHVVFIADNFIQIYTDL